MLESYASFYIFHGPRMRLQRSGLHHGHGDDGQVPTEQGSEGSLDNVSASRLKLLLKIPHVSMYLARSHLTVLRVCAQVTMSYIGASQTTLCTQQREIRSFLPTCLPCLESLPYKVTSRYVFMYLRVEPLPAQRTRHCVINPYGHVYDFGLDVHGCYRMSVHYTVPGGASWRAWPVSGCLHRGGAQGAKRCPLTGQRVPVSVGRVRRDPRRWLDPDAKSCLPLGRGGLGLFCAPCVGRGFWVWLCFALRSLALCRVCVIAPSFVSVWRAFSSVSLCSIYYTVCCTVLSSRASSWWVTFLSSTRQLRPLQGALRAPLGLRPFPGMRLCGVVLAGVLCLALRADVGRVLWAPRGPGPDAARGLGWPGGAGCRAWPLLGRLHLGGAPGAQRCHLPGLILLLDPAAVFEVDWAGSKDAAVCDMVSFSLMVTQATKITMNSA
jgi:hypothetical protein